MLSECASPKTASPKPSRLTTCFLCNVDPPLTRRGFQTQADQEAVKRVEMESGKLGSPLFSKSGNIQALGEYYRDDDALLPRRMELRFSTLRAAKRSSMLLLDYAVNPPKAKELAMMGFRPEGPSLLLRTDVEALCRDSGRRPTWRRVTATDFEEDTGQYTVEYSVDGADAARLVRRDELRVSAPAPVGRRRQAPPPPR